MTRLETAPAQNTSQTATLGRRAAITETCLELPRAVDTPVRAHLYVVYPEDLAGAIPLDEAPVVLGREPGDGRGRLDHPTVSRRHLALEWDRALGQHVAHDLQSRHGTYVDGVRRDRKQLTDGSVLRLGDLLLVYETLADSSLEETQVSRDAIPGVSLAVQRLRALVARAAPDNSPVLLRGETGTGKELVARELHRLSGRSGQFLTLHCAALGADVAERQLFGHASSEGLLRAADGGTLFLDEIGELPLALQPKLLRVLEQGEIVPATLTPFAATEPLRVNVRLIAATHQDPSVLVESERLRRDLYARLALWEIAVPALRERRRDMFEWVERLRARRVRSRPELGDAPLWFAPAAAERVLLWPWADNLRGIDRLVHELTATVAEGGAVYRLPGWLGREEPTTAGGRPPAPSREELVAALTEASGNVQAVARRYGRDRRQVYRWMEAMGIDPRALAA
jgi:DNA-binding NtrC family response regulator